MFTNARRIAPAPLCYFLIGAAALLLQGVANAVEKDRPLHTDLPFIDGAWQQIASNPDLGKLSTKLQQPVDFAIWQAADGTWQLWSCIRHTNCGGKTRLLYGWEAKQLTDEKWRPVGVKMEADTRLGETAGGLQAPHVVQHDGKYSLLYGDWQNICLATGRDGKTFSRHVLPNGKTSLFSEGNGANTRDICAVKIGDQWYGYYTAFPNHQGAVYCRTSPDLRKWSEPTVVAFGGRAGTGQFAAECPQVIERDGIYYLFRTQIYGHGARTSVYWSTDPLKFGINQDREHFLTELPLAAPEIVRHDGQDYIVALRDDLQGIQIAKLGWKKLPKIGKAIFNLDDRAEQKRWNVDGQLGSVFSNSERAWFAPQTEYFISTGELEANQVDDQLTGVVESPAFKIESPLLAAHLSGGTDADKLYVAIVDATTGEVLQRLSSQRQGNTLDVQFLDVQKLQGRKVKLRIVDESTAEWGRINFGGLYEAVP
ncbi:MAG: hypothetical protein SGJ20_08380 [Planctomycetota bacterium]|nr:hypothetical protein [Planctomycetota bacterium]